MQPSDLAELIARTAMFAHLGDAPSQLLDLGDERYKLLHQLGPDPRAA